MTVCWLYKFKESGCVHIWERDIVNKQECCLFEDGTIHHPTDDDWMPWDYDDIEDESINQVATIRIIAKADIEDELFLELL